MSNPWVVLATLLAIYIFNFADRYLVTGLVGPLKAEFGVGDSYMGLLMGPAFVLLYVLMGVPIARIADRYSRVKVIAAGCMLWSAATVFSGFSTSPEMLLLARVGVGIGEASFTAVAFSLLTDYFKPERRGIAFAILGLATYIGQIAGQGGGPAIAEVWGWRTAFFVMGAPGILLAGLALWLIREPVRTENKAAAAEVKFKDIISEVSRAPSYFLLMVAFGMGSLSGVAFGYWGPELFTRGYGIDPVTAKASFAISFGLSGLVGMLAFGAIADRLSRRGPHWPALLSAFSLFSATCCILAATWAPDFATARLIAIPSGLLGGGWSIGLMAVLQYLLPGRYRATATALFIAATTLLGYFVGPWATGAISQALGDDAYSLRMGLSTIIPAGILGALFAWLAVRTLERDRGRLEQPN